MPSSTTSFSRMAVVNGPIREEIGMNSGLGALSPFNHANAFIGRAWTLMTINLGDARPGETFMASMGSNLNYNNMTFAENEDRSAWQPFHVRKGFKKEESTVSIFQGWSAINSMGAAGCCRPAHEETLVMMQAFPCLREWETQALWLTTDFWYSKTASVDRWRPEGGVFAEDEETARRRHARQKRPAAALSRSGYCL